MRRVVVTGMGMVTPVGRDLESTWSALLEGKSGVGPITLFDARTFPTRIAAEVKDFRLEDYRRRCRPLGRAFAEHASSPWPRRRWPWTTRACSRRRPSWTDRRFGVYLGSGEGQQDFPRFVKLVYKTSHHGQGRRPPSSPGSGSHELHPIREAEQEPGTPAGHLASVFGAKGPNANCLTACAASSQAIGEAYEMIRGDAPT